MEKIFFRVLFVLSLAALFLIFPPGIQAVTVGPAKMEYSVGPGDVMKTTLFLMNETGEDAAFYPSFEKFIEEDGKKTFLKDESDLASWIETEAPVFLLAGEKKNVPFTIKVPENAEPGGHFAVIWWSTAPPVGGKQVSIVTRAGILVMLRVSGDIREEGRLLSFSTASSKKIFWSFPVGFSVTFKNDGNVHLKPTGEITVKNILGRTKAVVKVNEYLMQILPGSKRSFDVKWETARFAFGPYKAEISLAYGESQKQVSQSFWFVLIPLKTLIIVIFALLLVFFILPKGIKKYNQWIINKASVDLRRTKKQLPEHIKKQKEKKAKRTSSSSSPSFPAETR